jgi:hypothetical protein
MPEYICVCLGLGAWALVILLSTFVASELRAEHRNDGARLASDDSVAETVIPTAP